MDLTFCKLKKLLKKMNFIFFASLKQLQKHGSNFLQAKKESKNMECFQAKMFESHEFIYLFASYKVAKKGLNFLKASKSSKHMDLSFES